MDSHPLLRSAVIAWWRYTWRATMASLLTGAIVIGSFAMAERHLMTALAALVTSLLGLLVYIVLVVRVTARTTFARVSGSSLRLVRQGRGGVPIELDPRRLPNSVALVLLAALWWRGGLLMAAVEVLRLLLTVTAIAPSMLATAILVANIAAQIGAFAWLFRWPYGRVRIERIEPDAGGRPAT